MASQKFPFLERGGRLSSECSCLPPSPALSVDRHETWRGFPQVLQNIVAQDADAAVCEYIYYRNIS